MSFTLKDKDYQRYMTKLIEHIRELNPKMSLIDVHRAANRRAKLDGVFVRGTWHGTRLAGEDSAIV